MSIMKDITNNAEQNFPSLSFQVGRDRCSLTARCVAGILITPEATHIPEAPSYCKGIFTYLGRVIPLVELRSLFGMPSMEMEMMDFSFEGGQPQSEPQSIVIVLEDDSRALGLIVDKVYAVEVIVPINKEQSGALFVGSRFLANVGQPSGGGENTLMLNEQALLELCETIQY